MKNNYYNKLPKNILEDQQIKDLMDVCGYAGLGVFISIFLKCGAKIEECYIIRADKKFYKTLALEGSSSPRFIKKVVEEMVKLKIIRTDLFELGFIYMPLVAELDASYFQMRFNSNSKTDAELKLISNSLATHLHLTASSDPYFSITYENFTEIIFEIFTKNCYINKNKKKENIYSRVIPIGITSESDVLSDEVKNEDTVHEGSTTDYTDSVTDETSSSQKPKTCKTLNIESWHREVASAMLASLKDRDPNCENKNITRWTREIADLNQHRSRDEILMVLKFARQDDFWKVRINTPYDLKRHFVTLKQIMIGQKTQKSKPEKIKYTYQEMLLVIHHNRQRGKDFIAYTDNNKTIWYLDKTKMTKEQILEVENINRVANGMQINKQIQNEQRVGEEVALGNVLTNFGISNTQQPN